MELDSYLINLDTSIGKCTLGNIKKTSNGIKVYNKNKFAIHSSLIIIGIKMLGQLATFLIDEENIIYKIIPKAEKILYKNHKRCIEFIGLIMKEIDISKHIVTFSLENCEEIYVKTSISPSIQTIVLPFCGKKVNFILSTRCTKLKDRNKLVTSVYNYQELGNQLNDFSR
jgi:hypothetical protein